MKRHTHLGLVALAGSALLTIAMLTACGGAAATPEEEGEMEEMAETEEGEDEHAMEEGDMEHAMEEGEDEHAMEEGDMEHAMEEGEMEGEMEHSMDHLMIPEDAAAMENPVEASEASISAGAANFATVCAPCHGESGQGDGPAAVTLDPPPQDLTQGDAVARSDGELFYIISNGIEETGMVAWESAFSEEERWDLVNYIRSLQ